MLIDTVVVMCGHREEKQSRGGLDNLLLELSLVGTAACRLRGSWVCGQLTTIGIGIEAMLGMMMGPQSSD